MPRRVGGCLILIGVSAVFTVADTLEQFFRGLSAALLCALLSCGGVGHHGGVVIVSSNSALFARLLKDGLSELDCNVVLVSALCLFLGGVCHVFASFFGCVFAVYIKTSLFPCSGVSHQRKVIDHDIGLDSIIVLSLPLARFLDKVEGVTE